MLEPSSSEEEDYDTNQTLNDKPSKFAASHLNNTQLFNYHFQQQQLKQQQQTTTANTPTNVSNNVANISNVTNLSSVSNVSNATLPTSQQINKQPQLINDTQLNSQFNSLLSNNTKQITTTVPTTANSTAASTTINNQQQSNYSSNSNEDANLMKKQSLTGNFSNSNVQQTQANSQTIQSSSIQTTTTNQFNQNIQPTSQNIESPLPRTGSLRVQQNRRRSLIAESIQQHQLLTATSSDVLPSANAQLASNVTNLQQQPLTSIQLSQQQVIPQQQQLSQSQQITTTNKSSITNTSTQPPSNINSNQQGQLIAADHNITGTSNIILTQQQHQPTNVTQLNPHQMSTGAAVAIAIANSSGINCSMLINQQLNDKQAQNDYNNNPFNSITLAMIKQNSTNIAGSVGLGNQGSLTIQTANLLPNLTADQANIDEEQLALDREEQQHKIALQLYVFVVRSISYPFNAKQAVDMPRRPLKVNEPQLDLIKTRIKSLVKGELTINSVLASSKSKNSLYSGSNAILATSTATTTASSSTATSNATSQSNVISYTSGYVNSPICEKLLLEILSIYHDHFLTSDRLDGLVRSGGACLSDFRFIFRKLAEKKVKRSTEIDTYNKEQVLNSFVMKFDVLLPSEDQTYTQHYGNYLYYFVSNKKTTATGTLKASQQNQQSSNADVVLTKEQMYDIFSRILSIKKFEHQLLFNALQVTKKKQKISS